MRENGFQAKLIKEIKERYPGVIVLKNDPNYIQGIPDLSLLFPNFKWALLEVKANEKATKQPNQYHYINEANKSGFGAFIFPENKEEVLNEMERALGLKRQACDFES